MTPFAQVTVDAFCVAAAASQVPLAPTHWMMPLPSTRTSPFGYACSGASTVPTSITPTVPEVVVLQRTSSVAGPLSGPPPPPSEPAPPPSVLLPPPSADASSSSSPSPPPPSVLLPPSFLPPPSAPASVK